MHEDRFILQRCLDLAAKGMPDAFPNPLVGSVIVHAGRIIGEGYHRKFGEAHAEVNAINDAIAAGHEDKLAESTLYVNLEPCAHHGKTPPCCDLIIAKKIPRVVICNPDPFEKVDGRGLKQLTAAGITVQTGILEQEGRELNRRFFTFHEKKRPYIILKFARSADGFIAAEHPDETNRYITNKWSQKLLHRWRSEESAIMVGTDTALTDDPQLTVREWTGRDPVRIVTDRLGRLPSHLKLFDHSVPTIVYTEKPHLAGKNLEWVGIDFSNDPLRQIMFDLHRRGLQSLLVEGGAKLLTSFIRENLWDEARIFTGEKQYGKGLPAPRISGRRQAELTIDKDLLQVLRFA